MPSLLFSLITFKRLSFKTSSALSYLSNDPLSWCICIVVSLRFQLGSSYLFQRIRRQNDPNIQATRFSLSNLFSIKKWAKTNYCFTIFKSSNKVRCSRAVSAVVTMRNSLKKLMSQYYLQKPKKITCQRLFSEINFFMNNLVSVECYGIQKRFVQFLSCFVSGSQNTLNPGSLLRSKLNGISSHEPITTEPSKKLHFGWILSIVYTSKIFRIIYLLCWKTSDGLLWPRNGVKMLEKRINNSHHTVGCFYELLVYFLS